MSEPLESNKLPDLATETTLPSGYDYVGEGISFNDLGWYVPIKSPAGEVFVGQSAYGRAAALDAIVKAGGALLPGV